MFWWVTTFDPLFQLNIFSRAPEETIRPKTRQFSSRSPRDPVSCGLWKAKCASVSFVWSYKLIFLRPWEGFGCIALKIILLFLPLVYLFIYFLRFTCSCYAWLFFLSYKEPNNVEKRVTAPQRLSDFSHHGYLMHNETCFVLQLAHLLARWGDKAWRIRLKRFVFLSTFQWAELFFLAEDARLRQNGPVRWVERSSIRPT